MLIWNNSNFRSAIKSIWNVWTIQKRLFLKDKTQTYLTQYSRTCKSQRCKCIQLKWHWSHTFILWCDCCPPARCSLLSTLVVYASPALQSLILFARYGETHAWLHATCSTLHCEVCFENILQIMGHGQKLKSTWTISVLGPSLHQRWL